MNDFPEFFEPISLTASRKMQQRVNDCLDLIIQEDVDEVVTAFYTTFFLFTKNRYSLDEYRDGVLSRFLDHISRTLISKKYSRRSISQDLAPTESQKGLLRSLLHPAKMISNQVVTQIDQDFLKTLDREEGLSFLGELIGAYALAVPEPLFRTAQMFKGGHQTADILPIDDHLPMTDEMIIFAWQYFWFYTWLGY